MRLGAHESASGGPARAIERGAQDGCEAIQLFTKNNNRWKQRDWTADEVEAFREQARANPQIALLAHSSYLINLCSASPEICDKSRGGLADEMSRCQALGIPALVMHPGSPGTDANEWDAVGDIALAIDRTFDEFGTGFGDVTLLLENTAGQGSNLGWRYEHLRDILALTRYRDRVAVCFDTCHAFAAGYDFTDEASYAAHWSEFDDVVGLSLIRAFHLNDSKKEFGSRVDRHDHPGAGFIGLEPFRWLVNDARFGDIPGIVETPKLDPESDSGYRKNVEALRALRQ